MFAFSDMIGCLLDWLFVRLVVLNWLYVFRRIRCFTVQCSTFASLSVQCEKVSRVSLALI